MTARMISIGSLQEIETVLSQQAKARIFSMLTSVKISGAMDQQGNRSLG